MNDTQEREMDTATEWRSPRYEREIVDRVWRHALAVDGNDPELWRKDEFGAWIHRFAYGNHRSEFGWEIVDMALGRGSHGVSALRPAQWQNYLDQVAAHTQSRMTANGLRNIRRLL